MRFLTWLLLPLIGWATVPTLAVSRPCTELGTNGPDVRAGNDGRNILCLLRGNDYGHGQAGDDVLRGGRGNDTLVGGTGIDLIRGATGKDQLFSVDGSRGNDTIQGGPGTDRCYADHRDRMVNCEIRFRGGSPYPKAIVLALMRSMGGAIALGEEAQRDIATACAGHPAPPPICGP